jgi:hypothetical protein
LTTQEFKVFLGCVLDMGLVQLPEIRDYWSTEPVLHASYIRQFFSRNRFEEILHNLHITDNNSPHAADRPLWKIESMLDQVNAAFRAHWNPTERVAVDEGMAGFKGRLRFLQYNAKKPVKWGIKLFKLCDRTSYLYTCFIYAGAVFHKKPKNGLGFQVVKNLLSFLPKNHPRRVFTDNGYTSLYLAEDLLKQNMYLTGTVKMNTRGFPEEVKSARVVRQGDMVFRMKDNGVLALKWQDAGEVALISTAHGPTCEERPKRQKGPGGHITRSIPDAVLDYRDGMGFVDRHNQSVSYYLFPHKRYKWWHVLFFYILQSCVVNAWIIHREHLRRFKKPDQGQKVFQIQLIKALCTQTGATIQEPLVPSHPGFKSSHSGHFPQRLAQRTTSRCECGCGKRPTVRCIACNKPLDIDYFERFHTRVGTNV